MFSSREREAVGVFLHDLYHHKTVMAKMREITDRYEKDELLKIVYALRDSGILDRDELDYLVQRINKLYEQKL
jgi:hypothetical protein